MSNNKNALENYIFTVTLLNQNFECHPSISELKLNIILLVIFRRISINKNSNRIFEKKNFFIRFGKGLSISYDNFWGLIFLVEIFERTSSYFHYIIYVWYASLLLLQHHIIVFYVCCCKKHIILQLVVH